MTHPAIALPRPDPRVTARTLADGAVLFHAESETYFGLNPTGTVVWEAIVAREPDAHAAVDRLAAAHPDVDRDAIAADVRALLDDLARAGLVVAP